MPARNTSSATGARQQRVLAPFLLLLLLCFASISAAAEESGSIVCTCRCCYQGGCSALTNVSWLVDKCSTCTTKSCNAYISSKQVRTETARLFEGIQGEEAMTSGAVVVEECAVIAVLEAATCTTKSCKRTATIKAECYDRNAPLTKYSVISFVLVTLFAIVFGIVKNYIPAFQSLNEKYFNY